MPATDTYTDLNAVEQEMRASLVAPDAATAPLYGMMRYHLGWATVDFAPDASGQTGKRLRPRLCLLCCAAAGGDALVAVPAAAAIELLHNFTLIHDDIQDQSSHRHHRQTIWSRWGAAQAINVGDGMYAIAHQQLLKLAAHGVPAERIVRLMGEFDATVLRICEGQFLDVGFENRWDIAAADYVQMIGGKTAAIFAFAASAGATLAGADDARTTRYGTLGTALGLGFQLRDDLLGIWGEERVTGKPVADDIRRRKKSLPVIMLHERAAAAERAYLEACYASEEVVAADIATVLAMLDTAGVHDECQEIVETYHARAFALLGAAGASGPARDTLAALIARMADRDA